MIGTLRYVIQQLSKDDSAFTIDMLIDEIVTLEGNLELNEKAVNKLNLENKGLREEIRRLQEENNLLSEHCSKLEKPIISNIVNKSRKLTPGPERL